LSLLNGGICNSMRVRVAHALQVGRVASRGDDLIICAAEPCAGRPANARCGQRCCTRRPSQT
jgi:hypothetical protein